MTSATRETLKGLFKMDPSITSDQAKACIVFLSGSHGALDSHGVKPMVVSRREAAVLMGITPRRVDDFSRLGVLRRVYYPGNSRATGILMSSVDDIIAQGIR